MPVQLHAHTSYQRIARKTVELWAHIIDAVVAEAAAAAPPGVYVEPKGLTTTLHWRRARDQKDWVVAFAEHEHETRGVAIHEGRHERELRPPIEVDKGSVVRSLAEEYAGRLQAVAAFGDDKGDLPAFAALDELTGPDGQPLYTVRVAAVDTESPAEVAARADLTVAGAAGAVALLRALADAASAQPNAPPHSGPRCGRAPRPTGGRTSWPPPIRPEP